ERGRLEALDHLSHAGDALAPAGVLAPGLDRGKALPRPAAHEPILVLEIAKQRPSSGTFHVRGRPLREFGPRRDELRTAPTLDPPNADGVGEAGHSAILSPRPFARSSRLQKPRCLKLKNWM